MTVSNLGYAGQLKAIAITKAYNFRFKVNSHRYLNYLILLVCTVSEHQRYTCLGSQKNEIISACLLCLNFHMSSGDLTQCETHFIDLELNGIFTSANM